MVGPAHPPLTGCCTLRACPMSWAGKAMPLPGNLLYTAGKARQHKARLLPGNSAKDKKAATRLFPPFPLLLLPRCALVVIAHMQNNES